jgi:hypothetical protein
MSSNLLSICYSPAQIAPGQKLDKTGTEVGQVLRRKLDSNRAARLQPPKAPGVGMVSFSQFNLQMLQIVADCSQTVAGLRAKPKLLQTVHKLLQSVAGDRFDRSGQRACCNRFSNRCNLRQTPAEGDISPLF